MDEATLVLNVILYVLLPLWGLAGMLDWWCHRQTEIEKTSGLKEAYIHCLMGVQICIPLVLSLLFEVNVLIMDAIHRPNTEFGGVLFAGDGVHL